MTLSRPAMKALAVLRFEVAERKTKTVNIEPGCSSFLRARSILSGPFSSARHTNVTKNSVSRRRQIGQRSELGVIVKVSHTGARWPFAD